MATVAVVGSLITDLTVLTPRLPVRGENLLAHRLYIGPGGKGANAAVAARRLGAQVVLVGRVGDDGFGHQERNALRAEGVDVRGVGIDPHHPTGVAVILVDEGGENTILVVIGANDHLLPDHLMHALEPHWTTLHALLVDFEIPAATVRAAVETGHAHGIPVIVDTGPPRPYGPEIWSKATVLSPNRLELAALVGRPVETETEVRAAARELMEKGPAAVIVKLGPRGAYLLADGLDQHIPTFSVPVVDTTGAGDAFMGALTVALAEGMSLPEAVRFANAAGALATTRVGTLPVMPYRHEVEMLLRGSQQEFAGPGTK
ncbi:MAG: PfkB family carbohydrate kinase [Armatimonadota bacterium]|nr:PfkB family carbohydrate kinase [Armatimonadota bacterium]